jgi:YfiH family protein
MGVPTMILPAPSESFTWISTPAGPALVCQPLAEVVAHVFTTRASRLGASANARDEAAAWLEVARAIGVDDSRLARARQVHGTTVVTDTTCTPGLPEADILIGTELSGGVAVQSADCVPILMADPRGRVVAAVHAGWRGLVAGAPRAAVAALADAARVRPDEMLAAVGPSIGPCCYEVGPDVPAAFVRGGFAMADRGRWFHPSAVASPANPPMRTSASGLDRQFLDLAMVAADQLTAAGLRRDRIFVASLCTASHPEVFCSFRRDGAAAGRMAAAIRPRCQAFSVLRSALSGRV